MPMLRTMYRTLTILHLLLQLFSLTFAKSSSTAAAASSSGVEIKCNDYKTLEDNMIKLVGSFDDKRYLYPTKDAEFTKYCKNVKAGAKFTKDYAQQCLKDNASGKSILTITAYSLTQSTKKYCSRRNAKVRQEFFNFANCVNPHRKLMNDCFNTFIDQMNLTFSIQPDKNKFPYLCCITDLFSTCMTDKLRETKTNVCTEEAIQQFQQFYGSTMSNVMNFACENFEDQQDRCQTMVDNHIKSNGKLQRMSQWRTPFPIMIEFFNTL